MNIPKIQNYKYQPVFQARKQTLKDADKVLRTSKNTFPFVSSSYIRSFYLSSRSQSKNYEQALRKANKILTDINATRTRAGYAECFASNAQDRRLVAPYISTINSSMNSKTGNCQEQARAMLAVLAANGYYNSKYASLVFDVSIINKTTHEIVYTEDVALSHALVLTNMNKEKDLNIVIDPWLNFVDSKEGAIGRYKSLVSAKDLKLAYNKAKRNFFSKYDFPPDERNYVVIGKLKLSEFESTQEELERLGEYIKLNFPKAIIK